ncbi:S8 family serine peptidase [Nocardioides coralli]|uniref:S8 family serine peptidase n=1 Tax=Nocardioides coralli TaxID=2872154 RepID=UPI001CA3A48D|nr:S8 family serine peptidase [Nocardioides coralli]QZY28977.1 S8 family serine peptidase [Nocardioides coralli]
MFRTTSTTKRPLRAAAVLLTALAVLAPAAAAGSQIDVATVGGQEVRKGKVKGKLSGEVDVRGSALTGDTQAPQQPLVADAGDSSYVEAGDRAALLGAGFGGTEPYSFSWSSTAGEVVGSDAPTAALETAGLAPGRYPVTVRVTDADGRTASDEVVVVVYETTQQTLLEETKSDSTPGVTGTGQDVLFPFEVPAGVSSMAIDLTWGVPTNDYDLEVIDPDGNVKASSGNAPPEYEQTQVSKPVAGTWTVRAEKYATVADDVTASVVAQTAGADPRPEVSAGGPYTFTPEEVQQLEGDVTGGAAPVTVAWDLDEDGVFETEGASPVADLDEGRHLVTLKATDADGLERRQTTSVLVASPERLAADTTAVTVVGVADSGINPYHLEFSAQTYPDPDVLALTNDFTRHPSEYIPGYPADAEALPITLGQGYFPAADRPIWNGNETVKPGKMYWIPGTKIIGAVDAGGSTGVTSGDDAHPILDDNGHGSGSASVSTGNRYGYCPTCLLVVVEALDETVVAGLPWVDISSNSFGYIGGLPIGLVTGGSKETKAAAERGQTTLFAAGNGVGNAFDVPISTYGSDQTGPDWNITVGALRRDNQRAIVGDGIPVHLSAWGDGNLPSACRTGTVGQCAFGGTSAATPYTAGVFGTVLTEVRQALGDGQSGQKPGQVVATGLPLDESVYLADGELTRAELREVVLKTAQPLNTDNDPSPYPYPLTAPYTDANVLFEGYGAATPESAQRATDVLLGRTQLPEREFEDEFFVLDRQVRDSLYGGYDRDADGTADSEALAGGLGMGVSEVADVAGALKALDKVAAAEAPALTEVRGANTLTYYLHRRYAGDPGGEAACATGSNEQSMSRQDTEGDLEPCFESRVTSVVAGFRPLGIFPSEDELDTPLPAGSTVSVDMYLAAETPSAVRPTGVLMATDREIGTGTGAVQPVVASGPGGAACETMGEACWTRWTIEFETTRPAFIGEQLTVQIGMVGARSWAFGHEGAHASKVSIVPAEVPATGFEFGATITEPADGATVPAGESPVAGGSYAFPDRGEDPTGAGDHPVTERVEVSVDDPSFGKPVEAALDPETGTWSAPLGDLAEGEHTVYARAMVDRTASEVTTSTFTVAPSSVVEWQVVSRNSADDPRAWQPATGVEAWSYRFDTAAYGSGRKLIVTRLVEDGAETARTAVRARFR